MSRPHRRHRPAEESPGLLGRLIRLGLLAALLLGVGGVTWLALSPMPAPTREVTREVTLPPA
jgi:hypothetical protein